MKYSKYFGMLARDNGTPNLSPPKFQCMMNIVFLEGKIAGLKKAKGRMQSTDMPAKFDVDIFSTDMELIKLTGNHEPEVLFKLMAYDKVG